MRFHVGFSFSWKQLKKIIIPILIAIAVFLGLKSVNAQEVYTINYGTKATSVNPTSLPVVWNEGVQMVPSAQQLPVYIVNNTGTQFDSYYIRGFNISFSSPVAKTGKSYTIKAKFRVKSRGLLFTDNISSVMTPELVYEQGSTKIKDKSTTYIYYVNDDGSVDFTISSIVNLTENVDLSSIYLSFYNNNSFNGSNYDQWYFMKCWPNELGVCRDTDFYSQLILLDVETSISEDLNTTLLNGINDSINSGTDSIINNNNQNTQDIINNNNQNTQDIIDSQKVCDNPSITINSSNYTEFSSGYINANGNISEADNGSFVHTSYIPIYKEGSYTLTTSTTGGSLGGYLSYCLYDKNKTKINCYNYNNISTITNIDGFIRFSGYRYGTTTFSGRACLNGNEIIQDTITDSNIDDGLGTGFFDDFSMNDHGINTIITAPLRLINGLLDGSNCSVLTFTVMDTEVALPSGCILWNNVPTAVVTIYQTIVFGLVAYRYLIAIKKTISNIQNPTNDEIEVLNL